MDCYVYNQERNDSVNVDLGQSPDDVEEILSIMIHVIIKFR